MSELNKPGELHGKGGLNEHYFHRDPENPDLCGKCLPNRVPVLTPYDVRAMMAQPVRVFETGATRDTDEGKYDYEAFLSPLVIRRYAEYMHANRRQKDGSLRDGDNWQKGMGLPVFMKSAWRHFMAWWTDHRRDIGSLDVSGKREEDICAVLFNAMGYLHETLKARGY